MGTGSWTCFSTPSTSETLLRLSTRYQGTCCEIVTSIHVIYIVGREKLTFGCNLAILRLKMLHLPRYFGASGAHLIATGPKESRLISKALACHLRTVHSLQGFLVRIAPLILAPLVLA